MAATLDLDCSIGNMGVGVITFSSTAIGLNIIYLSASELTFSGRAVFKLKGPYLSISGAIATLDLSSPPNPDFTIFDLSLNWVAWSKIGQVSFTLDRTNDAGQMPMPWQGEVYQVKPIYHHNTQYVVVYGKGGIELLHGVNEPMATFARRHVSLSGLLSRYLVTGAKNVHYYVDNRGDLNELQVGAYGVPEIKNLGYREYLLQLGSNAIMLYDVVPRRVYFADGVKGFMYCAEFGLGDGPANLTACTKMGASVVYAAPLTLTNPSMQLCTDVIDFGTRNLKTLIKVSLATYNQVKMQFQVDYRQDVQQPWRSTSWQDLNVRGEGSCFVAAQDFRVRCKGLTQQYFQIEDLQMLVNINDRDLQFMPQQGAQQ